MAIDTSDKSFANLETTIGKLYLFALRVKEVIAIEKKLKGSIEKFSSEELLKLYLPFFSYLDKDLNSKDIKRPGSYTLTLGVR